jgi:hypothetical protein
MSAINSESDLLFNWMNDKESVWSKHGKYTHLFKFDRTQYRII